MQKNIWLTDSLYDLYFYRSKEFNVDIKLAISVIRAESQGRKVISKKNKNGTYDYGRFQVNSVHFSQSPESLLKDKLNSYYGFSYLSQCLKKSNSLSEAIRKYNQGLYGKEKYYKNWKYVEKILYCYAD